MLTRSQRLRPELSGAAVRNPADDVPLSHMDELMAGFGARLPFHCLASSGSFPPEADVHRLNRQCPYLGEGRRGLG
jgi:hypothetical protein